MEYRGYKKLEKAPSSSNVNKGKSYSFFNLIFSIQKNKRKTNFVKKKQEKRKEVSMFPEDEEKMGVRELQMCLESAHYSVDIPKSIFQQFARWGVDYGVYTRIGGDGY